MNFSFNNGHLENIIVAVGGPTPAVPIRRWVNKYPSPQTGVLNEELGLNINLQFCTVVDYCAAMDNSLWENERVHLFRANIDKDAIKVELNPDEVSQTKWTTYAQLQKAIEMRPQEFTPWLKIYVRHFPELSF